ncbi:TonB-dependent siderophore receptor [Hyphomicrobium sp.]|uniref:TonB-dependent siderophore receptor n=1 Tax=Hyphomicrobium sp. TaxID=82 RepID=UPI003F7057A2
MQSAIGPVNGYVAKNTSVGSKSNTPIQDIPQSVSVVGRQEIDDRGAQKVDEALRYTAGVFTQPFGTDSDTNWLFIRGFDATQTGIYQDGLQNYSFAFGAFYIDSFNLERIEVLKGAASVLYGGSNPGGIVNYVSKHPDGERIRYLETGINDAGNAYLGFDIGDKASSSVDYRVTGRIAGGETYSDFQDGFRGTISPTIAWHDDQTRLTLLANYTNIDENHGGGAFLPYFGTVKPASFGRIRRDANFTEPGLDDYDREQGAIGYELEHKVNSGLTLRQNARFAAADISESLLYGNGYDLTLGQPWLARVYFDHDTSVATALIDNQAELKFSTGAVNHTLLAGVDYKYFNIDQVQSSGLFDPALGAGATPINVVNPIYGLPQPPLASYLNQDLTQEQLGVYLQEQMRFGGGWIVTLNGRYDWVWTEADNRPNFYSPLFGTPPDLSGNDSQASGRAGIGYTFANGVTPYASVATFFNPVIGTDPLTGNLYVPETGEQYEVGVKYVPKFFDGIFTAALFDLTRQNVLTNNSPFTQIQVGEVRSRGLELEARANLTENLKVTGAFTAYDLEVTKDFNPAFVGKRPFVVPEVLASASFDYKVRGGALDGIIIGGGVRYIGSSYADRLNTLKVPDVTLFDAKIGYEFNDNWGIDLNVTNLADESYVASCQGQDVCAYGEGRVVLLKTHLTW